MWNNYEHSSSHGENVCPVRTRCSSHMEMVYAHSVHGVYPTWRWCMPTLYTVFIPHGDGVCPVRTWCTYLTTWRNCIPTLYTVFIPTWICCIPTLYTVFIPTWICCIPTLYTDSIPTWKDCIATQYTVYIPPHMGYVVCPVRTRRSFSHGDVVCLCTQCTYPHGEVVCPLHRQCSSRHREVLYMQTPYTVLYTTLFNQELAYILYMESHLWWLLNISFYYRSHKEDTFYSEII